MQRVKRNDLKYHVASAIRARGKIKIKDYTDDLKSPMDQVVDHLAEVALEQVFAHDAVVIRPDHGGPVPGSTVRNYPGKWDESEPWPEAFGPKPTRPEDI